MIDSEHLGPVYTAGDTFRARAEQRQREVRARRGWRWDQWGHWLDAGASEAGKNFVCDAAREAARTRQAKEKGVAPRTFDNMLSSQAMAFNLFAPLANDTELATKVLARVIPGLRRVQWIDIEHTPHPDVFRDQSSLGGVDCDLRIDGFWSDGTPAVVTVETKFVETTFSTCAFRDRSRLEARGDKKPRPYCSGIVSKPAEECKYATEKGYAYWQRTKEMATLAALPREACPFGGAEWQLWVNHVLAHVLAAEKKARPRYIVCAPSKNTTLVKGDILEKFSGRIRDSHTFQCLMLEEVIDAIAAEAKPGGAANEGWLEGLQERYSAI